MGYCTPPQPGLGLQQERCGGGGSRTLGYMLLTAMCPQVFLAVVILSWSYVIYASRMASQWLLEKQPALPQQDRPFSGELTLTLNSDLPVVCMCSLMCFTPSPPAFMLLQVRTEPQHPRSLCWAGDKQKQNLPKEYDEILQRVCASPLDREGVPQSWTGAAQYLPHKAAIGRSHGNKK